MPPHLESDDVDDIKTGTYVYWMRVSEDCRWHPRGPDGSYRGHVGHVTAVTAVTAVMEVTAVSICPSLSTSHRIAVRMWPKGVNLVKWFGLMTTAGGR
jgi:hypothetical protein